MTVYDPKKDQPPFWLIILVIFLLVLAMCEVSSAKRWYDIWNELFNHAGY